MTLVRHAKFSDQGNIEQLSEKLGYAYSQPGQEPGQAGVEYFCSVAEKKIATDFMLIGFCLARRVVDTTELLYIGVEPDARRSGIARRLIRSLLDWSRANAQKLVLLEVRESNCAARGLYESLGFLQTGKRKNYYPANVHSGELREDALLFSLEISEN